MQIYFKSTNILSLISTNFVSHEFNNLCENRNTYMREVNINSNSNSFEARNCFHHFVFQRELSTIDFTLNYQPIRNNLTSASLLAMLIETDYLNYPPIRNNLTSASLLYMIIEMDYNFVGYESHDHAALTCRNLPRQKYSFPFPNH